MVYLVWAHWVHEFEEGWSITVGEKVGGLKAPPGSRRLDPAPLGGPEGFPVSDRVENGLK